MGETTPLNDADEERLQRACERAMIGLDRWESPGARAEHVIDGLREHGVTLTIEPEPEPTYVYRMTGRELNLLISDIEFAAEQWGIEYHKRDSQKRLARLRALTPEER